MRSLRRMVGFTALAAAGISFILWMWIVVSGSGFSQTGMGLNGFAVGVLFSWMVSIITAVVCLIGDVIRFIGKTFGEGFGKAATVPCLSCGKAMAVSAVFCPHCGTRK